MAGNDDLTARLRTKKFDRASWADFGPDEGLVNPDGPEAADKIEADATVLAERDATIERLEDALESVKQDAVDARSERDEARAETAKVAALAEDLMNDKLPGALETLSARAETAERELAEARAEVERLKGLLWYSWYEFNAIKARHGAPVDHYLMLTVDPEFWEQLTEAFAASIGPEDAKPWPSTRARAALQQSEVKP